VLVYGVIDNHPSRGFVIFFLLRGVHPMRAQIDREAMNRVLHGEVFKLPIMIRIVLMPLMCDHNNFNK
jgi:hypothetical protein